MESSLVKNVEEGFNFFFVTDKYLIPAMNIEDYLSQVTRSTTEVINPENLKKKFLLSQKSKRPLMIKAGFDPTAPDIHLGHIVLLRKLRQFQDLGHKVLFLIGDFTARIGDPTGQDQIRPVLDDNAIKKNAKSYESQVFKILDTDPAKLEVVFNSSWLGQLTSQEALQLTKHSTVAQMLARADFKKRYEKKIRKTKMKSEREGWRPSFTWKTST